MYLPDKMNEIIREIKTLNYRLLAYQIIDKDIVNSAFYNQFKLLYDNLLFDIQVQVTMHVQASTMMLQGFNSYLNDYKA